MTQKDKEHEMVNLMGHAAGVQEPGGELRHLLLLVLQQVLPHIIQQVRVGAV